MGAAQKRLQILMQNIFIIEKIYIEYKLESDYWDRLQNLKQRILKLPDLSIKNPKYLMVELKSCIQEYKDIEDEIHPNVMNSFREKYGITGMNGDINVEDV